MLNSESVARYVLAPPVFEAPEPAPSDVRSAGKQLAHLAELAAKLAGMRRALKEQSDRFDELERDAEQAATTPAELEEAANALLDLEHQMAAAAVPQVRRLQLYVAKQPATDFARSLQRSAEEGLEIAQTWLELYQNLRIRLLKLASDRRAAAGETGSPILSDAAEMEQYLRRLASG